MTSNERKDLFQTGTNNQFKQSAYDANKQIKDGKSIIHVGTNRTIVDGKICYGSSSAKNAINGK